MNEVLAPKPPTGEKIDALIEAKTAGTNLSVPRVI